MGVWMATRANRVGNLGWRSHSNTVMNPSDIQRSVGRPHVPHPDQQHVNEGPDAQTAEAEELPQTFSPLTQIEAVRTEAAQSDAAHTDMSIKPREQQRIQT